MNYITVCVKLKNDAFVHEIVATKSLEWMNDKGLQLPNSLSATQGSWGSVPTEDDVVNEPDRSDRIVCRTSDS